MGFILLITSILVRETKALETARQKSLFSMHINELCAVKINEMLTNYSLKYT